MDDLDFEGIPKNCAIVNILKAHTRGGFLSVAKLSPALNILKDRYDKWRYIQQLRVWR